MNTISKERSIQDKIPENPRDRGNYYKENYGHILESHLINLHSCCPYFPKGQGISFSGIEDGYMHAHYGKYSIFFPITDLYDKTRSIDWKNIFDLEIDGNRVPIDYGINEVQKEIQDSIQTIQGWKNKLLPPKIDIPRTTTKTSQNVIIKRSLRIIVKNH